MVNWKIIIILIVIEIERLGLGYLYYNGMENYQSAFVCELKSFAFHGFVCSFIAAISAAIRQISKMIWRWSKKKKKKQWMKKNYCVHRKGKGKRRPKARKKAKKRWCSMEKTQIWGHLFLCNFAGFTRFITFWPENHSRIKVPLMKANNKHE